VRGRGHRSGPDPASASTPGASDPNRWGPRPSNRDEWGPRTSQTGPRPSDSHDWGPRPTQPSHTAPGTSDPRDRTPGSSDLHDWDPRLSLPRPWADEANEPAAGAGGPTASGPTATEAGATQSSATQSSATQSSATEAEAGSSAAATAGDSLTVAAWTIVSRVTGVARFIVIGAVLGPTYFGNTYQFTNSLPNLVYYGFLAGSLFSSLLVPALVRHIDAGDRRACERLAGGFLGISLMALIAIAPLAIVLGPMVLRFATLGGGVHLAGAEQVQVARLLIVMFIPQIFCYGVVGTATAVMNSRQRFALAAGAPAVENIGTIAVLLATGVFYGTGTSLVQVPRGEMLLLGLGSTGAVALHAATQWWGAKRAGVALLPRLGWRDQEVLEVVRRAVPSLAQAGLLALQVLTLLAIANRLPGGVVAFQIALNFYYLAIALGAAPVALSLLPRLARQHMNGDTAAFRDTLVRGLALGFFLTIPAAVGYLALAVPLARGISFGRMDGHGAITMVAVSLAALAVAVVGQTAFLIATYASYAKKDTRSPLKSMVLQAIVCLSVASTALRMHGSAVLLVLGLALAAAVATAACHLMALVWRDLTDGGTERLTPSLAKFVAGAVIMAGPAWVTATTIPHWLGRPLGPRVAIVAAAVVGGAIFLGLQGLFRTPELGWLAGGLGHMRGKARTGIAGVTPAGAVRGPDGGLWPTTTTRSGLRPEPPLSRPSAATLHGGALGAPPSLTGSRQRPSSDLPWAVTPQHEAPTTPLPPITFQTEPFTIPLPPVALQERPPSTPPPPVRRQPGPPPPLPSWDGANLQRRPSSWLALPLLAAAFGVGVVCAYRPWLALIACLLLLLAACVWVRPTLAAYLLIVLTPLTTGINRGSALPLLRPNEALAVLVGGTLAARALVRLRTGQFPKLRLDRVELAMVIMAVTNSVVPLLWMLVRQHPITRDDLLYALVLWKFLGIYAIIRAAVTSDRHVRRCLVLSVGAASVVGFLAILQSLGLFGVPHVLATFYAPFGYENAFQARGSSTLGLPAATADFMVFNLAVVSGLWIRFRRYRLALAVAAGLFVMGALSAGEFSSAIGLIVGVVCISIVMRRPRLLSIFLPAGIAAGFVLRPVISTRLSGFQSASGLPTSWTGRLQNLQTYFWPKLSSEWNFLLGVRPDARIPVPTQATGFVWIESGYTWLLWGGGIPLVAGFAFFVYSVVRRGWEAGRSSEAARGGQRAVGNDRGRSVAGGAVFAAVFVITVLMAFDPHLTYRGSADSFFFLLALAAPRQGRPGDAGAEHQTSQLPSTAHPAPVMTEVHCDTR
jgi:putative peptidoglycan lipid II flippase